MGADLKQAIEQKDTDRAAKVLTEAKAELRHGRFTAWLQQNGINERTARRYLKLKTDSF